MRIYDGCLPKVFPYINQQYLNLKFEVNIITQIFLDQTSDKFIGKELKGVFISKLSSYG